MSPGLPPRLAEKRMVKNRCTPVGLSPTHILTLAVLAWSFLTTSAVTAPPKGVEAPAHAEQGKAALGEDWVRLRKGDQDNSLALEVAIVRYVPAEIARKKSAHASYASAETYVDLVGAVHVGDRAYYQKLNRRFRAYDALLYELVAPDGTVVEQGRGTSSAHPLGALQNGMKSMLEVEHQLEVIDYTRPNFVHADMSPEQFRQSMQDRDESFLQMYFRLAGQAIAMQSQQALEGESSDLDLMAALFSKDRPRKLKIVLAKQFELMEAMLTSISGPDGSTIITERNKRALEILRAQQAAGKRKIGIFYGAGHLADMHERLV